MLECHYLRKALDHVSPCFGFNYELLDTYVPDQNISVFCLESQCHYAAYWSTIPTFGSMWKVSHVVNGWVTNQDIKFEAKLTEDEQRSAKEWNLVYLEIRLHLLFYFRPILRYIVRSAIKWTGFIVTSWLTCFSEHEGPLPIVISSFPFCIFTSANVVPDARNVGICLIST